MSKAEGIKEGHIGSFELTSLLIITMSLKVLLTLPRLGIIISLSATWILAFLLMINGLIAFYFINKLFLRFPNLSMDEINNKVLGKWFGGLANLAIIVFLSIYIIIYLREFAELIIASTLPNTPISVILLIFMLAVLYGSYLGIEPMTRASFLIYPFLFAGFLFLILLVLPKANTLNIYPILGSGLIVTLKGSILSVSRFGEGIILLGLLIPFIRNKKSVSKIGYTSILVVGLTFTFSNLVYVLIFSIPSAITNGIFPMFQMARIISVGSFLQRLESIFVFIWIFTALISVRAVFYGLNLVIARQLKLTVYRPLIFPLSILFYTLAFLPPDFLSTVSFEVNILRKYGVIPAVIIPIFVLVIAKIRGLKEV